MERSLGRVVTGAVFVIAGGAWLLDSAGVIDLRLRMLLAIALIVIGVGLVVASWRGGHGGLLAAAIVSAVVLASTTGPGFVTLRGDRGAATRERLVQPRDDDDLRPYRVDAGQLVIDLTDLDPRGTSQVEGSVGAGQIVVRVPRDIPIRVDAETGTGSIFVFGERRASGVSADDVFESDDYDDERPRISMRLRASVGSIRVEAIRGRR